MRHPLRFSPFARVPHVKLTSYGTRIYLKFPDGGLKKNTAIMTTLHVIDKGTEAKVN
jgi:hypothetical protein